MATAKRTHDDYLIGWICPLEVELIAAEVMLDEEHECLTQPTTDLNAYTLGSINGHNIVIATLPVSGNWAAATVVAQMRTTFPQLRFGLLVGIGGGVPTKTDSGLVHLGHVIVSKPSGMHSGAIQYDRGKEELDGLQPTGFIMPPPPVLLSAAQQLAAKRARARKDPLLESMQRFDTTVPGLKRYRYPGVDKDRLFKPDYDHPVANASCRKAGCEETYLLNRYEDDESDHGTANYDQIVVHRGTIASGERVIKNGVVRDELAKKLGLICFETEAAGSLNEFRCLIVRGVSDYCDSHKNDIWHGYAAGVAAAYARQLFFHIPIDAVKQCSISEADVEHILTTVNTIADTEQWTRLAAWLDAPDPSVNLNKALKARHDGTGLWLTTGPGFEDWKTKHASALWLYGQAGSGKTILSSTIIQTLQKRECNWPIPNEALLYFYFDFSDSKKQSHGSMMRSILLQLCKPNTYAEKKLQELYSTCNSGLFQPTQTSLELTFIKALETYDRVFLLIDALDECMDRRDLLEWLEVILSLQRRQSNLHVIMTSREVEDVRARLKKILRHNEILPIQSGLIDHDIRSYVQGTLHTDVEFGRWKTHEKALNMIEDRLNEKSNGMFRWIACQLDTLRTCKDFPSLKRALESLPETLDETYARMLESIDTNHRIQATVLLQFMLTASEPLLLDEAVDIVAVFPEESPAFSPENRMPHKRDVAAICNGLVSVVTTSTIESKDSKSPEQLVQLSHFSVQEYLQSSRVLTGFNPFFTKSSISYNIARTCLAYLMELRPKDTTTDLPLSPWAARHWFTHVESTNEVFHDLEDALWQFFSQETGYFGLWLRYHSPDYSLGFAKGSIHPDEIAPKLYYAASYGLMRLSRRLIQYGATVNESGGLLGNPLQAAAFHGQEKVVQLLLEHGADPNAQAGYFNNALQAASCNRNVQILQMLLDAGANVHLKGGFYEGTLLAASLHSTAQGVRKLLDAGADVNVQYPGSPKTALVAACSSDTASRPLLVRQAGLDSDRKTWDVLDRVQSTSYILSNQYSHAHVFQSTGIVDRKQIVQTLLDAGAEVNSQGSSYSYAIRAAADADNVEAVKLLLEADIASERRSENYEKLLEGLPRYRNLQTVQKLLAFCGNDFDAHRNYDSQYFD